MSNEYHSPASMHPANKEPRLIDLRFALRNLLAKTALADIYWANDLHSVTDTNPEKNALILLVTPALVHQQGFAEAFQKTLSRPAPPSSAYPDILAYGENSGEYWLALNNINGELLSERIRELDERGLPLDNALDTLENISHVLSGIQAGPFGYLEPGAIQKTPTGYIILNAPLVKVQQQLTTSSRAATNKLALHSGYISPSVAVGDTPVTEDDTFSAAALLYALLAGAAPYGERSTLTSVTQEYKPAPLKKLSKNSWEVLSSALAFQRKPRAENPDKLLTALRKANKRNILFPVTVAAALGIVAFAVYHLTSKVGEMFPASDNTQQQVQVITQEPINPEPSEVSVAPETTQQPEPETELNTADTEQTAETTATKEAAEPVTQEAPATEVAEIMAEPEQEEVAPEETITTTEAEIAEVETEVSEAEKAEAAEIAAIELVDEPELEEPSQAAAINEAESTDVAEAAETLEDQAKIKQERISILLKNAETAISKNQIRDSDNTPGALSFLRQINELDKDNPQANTLINNILDSTFNQAEQQIDANDFSTAQTNLSEGDKIIREFMVTGQLQRLVRLESKLGIVKQEDQQVSELLVKAKDAIRAGNLTKDDSGDEHALLHLTNLMFKQPNNPEALELLKEIVKLRQQNARAAIAEGELEQAGTYLGESERLIRKYRFSDLQEGQRELDNAYANEITQPAPIADIQRSPEVEVIELQPAAPETQNTLAAPIIDTFTEQASQLPVETLPVNPIRIQEVETVVIDEVAPVDEVLTEAIPDLNTAPAAVPIWESGALGDTSTTISAQPQPSIQPQVNQAAQPVIRYEPQQVPQPQVAQPVTNNNGQEIYTYQPENQQFQPEQPVFNEFNAPANPIGAQAPVAVAPEQQYQPQPQQQPQYQPQQVQIPEIIPLDIVPELGLELEEIPLSDIEEILPATN